MGSMPVTWGGDLEGTRDSQWLRDSENPSGYLFGFL